MLLASEDIKQKQNERTKKERREKGEEGELSGGGVRLL